MDPSVLRVRAPKVAQNEPETYSADQLDLIVKAATAAWARLAILILLGTGMRVSELCALIVEDVEDGGEATFLKVRKGRGPAATSRTWSSGCPRMRGSTAWARSVWVRRRRSR